MSEERDALVQAKRAGTPSYSLKVGDSVILGAIESVYVEKVLYDGLCYEVCCTKVDKTTGKRTLEHCIEPWCKIRPKFFGKSEFTTNEDIRLNYSNITIESLLFKHLSEFGGIDFMPPYQREYVWTDSDKEQLLDSIFMGSDIGKFTVRVLDDVEWFERQLSYEIIDGKQRLMTLLNFYLNRFPYKGFYYNGLSVKDRRTFLDHTISWAEVKNLDKKTTLRLFLLLNRGGRPVSDAVIERAGELLKKLEKCEKTKEGEDV